MTLWLAAAGVALVPVLLGGEVAARLDSARWTRRHPRAALVSWQAMGLAAGLGAVGIGLVAAVGPLAAIFPHGMHVLARQLLDGNGLHGLGPGHMAALAWSAGLIVWLVAHTIRMTAKVVREQRRLRLMVDVVGEHSAELDAYVLPDSRPVAYCVPGRRARVVLSQGTLDLLDERQLGAVLAHERAHARGHHDLVLLPFLAFARAFPWLPAAKIARRAVPLLLEMLADDRAKRRHGEAILAETLVRMATAISGQVTAGAPALAEVGALDRVERLLRRHPHGARWAPLVVYPAAGMLVSGPLAVLMAPLLCLTVWPA
ncbi:M56 family metallopeptidase [Planotetraspora kaengkrachanensis]|uniref:Peptidase M48 domain-containing protein n=1 Tax=Planotetraspora kaengkrachanensis TaxID=575193 RepID=A0A8J3M5Z6_9ACTN|nr:M56 family metallopeptidase [Planotetraspora kaengkrachanensis]GIG77790.1 hypothetical protein Pka01_09170 [Planotetraspora kaengkrachanensis]